MQETALEYFMTSPFYEQGSNNGVLLMQLAKLQQGQQGQIDQAATLRSMKGTEYELMTPPPADSAAAAVEQQSLFVVKKQYRTSPTTVQLRAVYYILNGDIFQAPDLHAVLTSRLRKCAYNLHGALQSFQQIVNFHPTMVVGWDYRPPVEQPEAVTAMAPATTSLQCLPGGRLDRLVDAFLTKQAAAAV
eukprot:TRINITY_DN349_c0_g1_i2.p1 TRINITY_DN349_c0_g1~~TRINITY_DN349_c0_g1_i2.p1  ORF type:complete len:189 (-),score=66.52 TRINITY_DN349_c0_g1_i2:35-601(-)